MEITKSEFDFEGPEFRLSSLIEIDLVKHRDEVEEVTDGADKQLKIEFGLAEITVHYALYTLYTLYTPYAPHTVYTLYNTIYTIHIIHTIHTI